MRDEIVTTKTAVVNLQSLRGTHWVIIMRGLSFDFYGRAPPKMLTNRKNKRKTMHFL